MSLENALAAAGHSIPECIATALVDMKSGMLLGERTVEGHSTQTLALVAAAAAELFQGQNVAAIEQLFGKLTGTMDGGNSRFQEIVILSDHLVHLFQRCRGNSDLVLVIVCSASANVPAVLDISRTQLPIVEAAA